ncbi:MAG TPA: hypothetical protein VG963_20290 [Polyangiaceae bacterium]|nr:hypothetical protein [Polyangiaceae bacterium]
MDAALDSATLPVDSGVSSSEDASGEAEATTPLDSGAVVPADAGAESGSSDIDAGLGCVAGTYRGVFEGIISAFFGLVQIEISGTISIEVPLSGSGDMFSIQNGKIDGADQDHNPIAATVLGTVNCTTGKIENGQLVDGTYTRPDLFGTTTTTITFAGTVDGTYYNNPPSAIGRWQAAGSDMATGSGTWTASLQR